ncbi:hypothetical protein CWN24_27525, partial [Klebsiella pneumoniae]
SLESAGELSIREQKFLKLAKSYLDVAAENVGLNSFIVDACWIVDDGQYCDATDFMPETPATDRIVAGIKADGVEEFINRLQQCVDEGDFVGDEVAVIVGAIDCGKEFFEQLREGARHD